MLVCRHFLICRLFLVPSADCNAFISYVNDSRTGSARDLFHVTVAGKIFP